MSAPCPAVALCTAASRALGRSDSVHDRTRPAPPAAVRVPRLSATLPSLITVHYLDYEEWVWIGAFVGLRGGQLPSLPDTTISRPPFIGG